MTLMFCYAVKTKMKNRFGALNCLRTVFIDRNVTSQCRPRSKWSWSRRWVSVASHLSSRPHPVFLHQHFISSACDVIVFWWCVFLENLTLSRIVKTELARACGESVLQEDDDDVTALRGGDLEESYIAPAQTQSPRPRTMTQQQPSQPVAINVRWMCANLSCSVWFNVWYVCFVVVGLQAESTCLVGSKHGWNFLCRSNRKL